MARRFFKRSFRRGPKPLRRWTAFNDEFVVNVDDTGNTSYEGIIVGLDTYQQNENLEPDGCTVLRCIGVISWAGIANLSQVAPVGAELDAAVIVQDVDASLVDALTAGNWSGTMIRERVLWWTRDRVWFNTDPVGATMVSQNQSNELRVNEPCWKFDFNVRARLQQKTVLKLAMNAFVTLATDENVQMNASINVRTLLGGKF